MGAHVVPGRQRNEKPVSSMKTMAACFRRAFFADPRPILLKPGPDHFLISLFGVNGRDLWAPTRSPEPSGQVITKSCAEKQSSSKPLARRADPTSPIVADDLSPLP